MNNQQNTSCGEQNKSLTPESENHPIQRLADRILDECIRQNWGIAFVYAGELVHYCLGRGYYVLAKTVKKLRYNLFPRAEEPYIRKYLLRMMWLLARVRREKNYRYLIRGEKSVCKLKCPGSAEMHMLKFHTVDPDAYMPPLSFEETREPRIARILSSEMPVSTLDTFSDKHTLFQPPHIKFPVVHQGKSHTHQEIPIPKMDSRVKQLAPEAEEI